MEKITDLKAIGEWSDMRDRQRYLVTYPVILGESLKNSIENKKIQKSLRRKFRERVCRTLTTASNTYESASYAEKAAVQLVLTKMDVGQTALIYLY